MKLADQERALIIKDSSYIWYISDYFKRDYTNKIKGYRETETSNPLLATLGDGRSSPEWGWS